MRARINVIRNSNRGASMIIGVFILMLLLVLAGLLIDGGRIILAFNKLFHCTYISAGANIASYDRELWKTERKVEFDIPLAELIIREELSFNMEEAEIKSIEAISLNSMKVQTQCSVPVIFLREICGDELTLESETYTFIVD